MANDFIFRPTQRQALALQILSKSGNGELLYGGAKGGGKSHFLCAWSFVRCKQIIGHCQITERPEFPYLVGFMGRKRGSDFSNTTLETWKRVIPSDLYEIKGKPAEIIIDERVKVLTGGLDNMEVVNKFNSAELHFFCIDQAEETAKDDISVLRGTLRQKINGKHLPYKALWTANPKQCWLKTDFVDANNPRYAYVPALPADNPYLPDGYIDTLTEAFQHRPELLAGYLHGDWACFDTEDQVIKGAWLAKAEVLTLGTGTIRRLIVCDPARFGDDETVIYLFENTRRVAAKEIIYGQKDTHYTSGRLHVLSRENGCCPIMVDGDGIGGGIVDNLSAYGDQVIEFRGSEASRWPERFYNRRAEAWSYVARAFCDGDIEYRNVDSQLTAQLCTPTYEFRNGRILIEAKDAIKQRLGRSPDRADTFVMGIYGLQFVDPVDTMQTEEMPDIKTCLADSYSVESVI